MNEEVKEMKSVDEETNKDDADDDEEYSDDNENDTMGVELQDINDIKTPPKDHEQNE